MEQKPAEIPALMFQVSYHQGEQEPCLMSLSIAMAIGTPDLSQIRQVIASPDRRTALLSTQVIRIKTAISDSFSAMELTQGGMALI